QAASVILAATASVIANGGASVFHAATGDVAPLPTTRAVELTGLFARQSWRERDAGSRIMNWMRSRLEPVPASKRPFSVLPAPAIKGAAQPASRLSGAGVPRWGAPRIAEIASDVKARLGEVERMAGRVDDAFQLFMPFLHDNHVVFRADQTRALFAAMPAEDRAKLCWEPEKIEWRDYFLRVHFPGLRKWVFPDLEEEFQPKLRAAYTYKDLLELFDATTKLHKGRVAFRQLPPPGSDAPIRRFTYRQVAERTTRMAAVLAERGVAPG